MQTTVDSENYFDVAQGLYWACVDCHGGQFSDLYRIQCQLDYNPGMSENGPDGFDAESVYAELVELCESKQYAKLDEVAQAYLEAVQAAYDSVHD